MSDSNAGRVGQIFGVQQRFAAKTGKHQAHQLRARRFDGKTRRKAGRGSEIINAASFSIRLKQFLNCVPRCHSHLMKYAPAGREKKGKYAGQKAVETANDV